MTHAAPTPQVALSKTFMKALGHLDTAQKRDANQFVMKFKGQPTAPDFNFELVGDAFDDNLRLLRVSRGLRAVVFRPEEGNAYVLLWMGPPEEARAWARRRSCKVHPDTGALQVFVVDHEDEQLFDQSAQLAAQDPPAPEPPPTATEAPGAQAAAPAPQFEGLFGDYSGSQLRRLGVPPALMYRVRHLDSREAFDKMTWMLSEDTEDALVQIIDGAGYNTVLQQVYGPSAPLDRQVDLEDYASALATDTSRSLFKVVEDEEELARMMDQPLATWRTYLHRSQIRLVERDHSGPVRVLGGAGTGKTVVAMHRAVKLARDTFPHPNDRILVTTYTRNLAADIQENLRQLCSPEVMRRIEVVHLDGWVSDFLKRQGFERQIKYFSHSQDSTLADLWEEAMAQRDPSLSFPPTFYREEWEQVIQGLGVTTAREYYRVSRSGRGVRLARKQRHLLWLIFEEYRNLMADHGVCEREGALRAARHILVDKGDILPYRSILVDEAQDMSNEAFKLIRQMVPEPAEEGRPNDIFIVGDGHQRIYNHKVVLGQCGIRIVGRAHRLRINYRTTAQIQHFAMSVLEGLEVDDLDGGADSLRGYRSLIRGDAPRVEMCPSFQAELETICAFLGQDQEQQRSTCLVTRTHKLLDQYAQALAAKGYSLYPLSRNKAEDASQPGLRLATMHRVKGLEFERVILAGLNQGLVPLEEAISHTDDDTVQQARRLQERALFYVACSRARRQVLLTSSGDPSPFLPARSET